jgi:cation diffusion facilitator family transporter
MAGQPSTPALQRKAYRAALISLFVALALVAAKVAAALASRSLALLSEAAHSALDAAATGLTYIAVRIASRPPDEDHPYGHGKAENLSALVETLALLALSIYIAVRAITHLRTGESEVEATWYAFAVIILSIVVDANRSTILKRIAVETRSPALEADALNFRADLLTSTMVLVGLVLVRLGYPRVDAVASLAIAGYVALMSVKLGKKSVDMLMDRAPEGSMEQIAAVAAQVKGVGEVRRVRVRHVGGDPQADVVIALSRRMPLETAHELTERVERVIRRLEPGADVMVHVEPLADETRMAQQVEAIALKQPVVAQVHNIFVTYHPEGHHIALDARFPGDMPIHKAHSIAEELEAEILREIPGVSRVDTHLEPLGEGTIGKDVTANQSELVEWTKRLAERQPEVHNCHEVLVTDIEGGLAIVMHCDAYPALSVEAVHEASNRIENETHTRWPEVKRVTVHFEPAGVTD